MDNNSNITSCNEEYFKKEIEQIEDLKAKGHTAKYILDLNAFSYEAIGVLNLKKSGIGVTAFNGIFL